MEGERDASQDERSSSRTVITLADAGELPLLPSGRTSITLDASEQAQDAESPDSGRGGLAVLQLLAERSARHSRARSIVETATVSVRRPRALELEEQLHAYELDEPLPAEDHDEPEEAPYPPLPPEAVAAAETLGRDALQAMERGPEGERRRAAAPYAALEELMSDPQAAATRAARPSSPALWPWLEDTLECVLSLANAAPVQAALAGGGGLPLLADLAWRLEGCGAGGVRGALHALVTLCNVAECDRLRGAVVDAGALPLLERLAAHPDHHVAFEACYIAASLACASDPGPAAAIAARPALLSRVEDYVLTHDAATEGTAYDWLDIALKFMAAAARSALPPIRSFAAFCFANVAHKRSDQLRGSARHLEAVRALARSPDRTAASLALIALSAAGGGLAAALLRERHAALAAAGAGGAPGGSPDEARRALEEERDAFWRASRGAEVEAGALRSKLAAARAEAARLAGDPAALAAMEGTAAVEAHVRAAPPCSAALLRPASGVPRSPA
eukprot:tig00020800_g13730.t1